MKRRGNGASWEVRELFETTRVGRQCLIDAYARLLQFIGRAHEKAIAKTGRRPLLPHQNREVGMSDRQVALYARVSTEQQARDNTIASQVAALRERIAADGNQIEPDHAFVDEGYSGSILVRPAMERLRDAVAAGQLERVYVLAPDRLARRYAHQVLVMEEFLSRDTTDGRSSILSRYIDGDEAFAWLGSGAN